MRFCNNIFEWPKWNKCMMINQKNMYVCEMCVLVLWCFDSIYMVSGYSKLLMLFSICVFKEFCLPSGRVLQEMRIRPVWWVKLDLRIKFMCHHTISTFGRWSIHPISNIIQNRWLVNGFSLFLYSYYNFLFLVTDIWKVVTSHSI